MKIINILKDGALPGHVDIMDEFVLQIEGEKLWNISSRRILLQQG